MGSGTGNFLKVIARNFDVLAGWVIDTVHFFSTVEVMLFSLFNFSLCLIFTGLWLVLHILLGPCASTGPVLPPPLVVVILDIKQFEFLHDRYASIRAIETKSPEDDRQWLTYWILYSMITLFELTFAKLIEWIPFWSYAKLIATCWLVLPYFSGATYVYEHYVRPFYMNPQRTVNIWYVPRKKDIFSKPDDILTAAEKYIEENGPEAFENLISKADRETRSRSSHYTSRSSNHTFFEDEYRY